jgi:hypothetical protein
VNAYLDTSVLLRVVLREPDALEDIRSYDGLVSSEVLAVESYRTIDRLRLQGALTTEEASVRVRVVADWLEAVDLVLLRPPFSAGPANRSPRHSARWTPCTSLLRSSGVTASAHR